MKPTISVVMPAYNGEKYIGKAIESILCQTYDNFELVIVEDASSDKTLDIIKEYTDARIVLIQNCENRGIAFSTNLGIDHSRGAYIALLDDDDMATPKRLEWQLEYLEKHKEIDILGGRSAYIDKDGHFLKYGAEPLYNPKYIKANLLFYNRKFANCTMMMRKKFFVENNLRYKDNCLGMQDLKFYMDSSKVGNISSIDRLLHLKRLHEEEETVRAKKFFEKERAALFAKFQRESIKQSGFCLKEEHLQAINDNITEIQKDSYTKEDILRLYEAFCELISQARAMKIDYLTELEFACKKILGDKILTRADIFS